MYTYEYERIYSAGVIKAHFKDHEEVIARRAKNGWRYAGFIPAVQSNGSIVEIDLIFEKEL